MRNKKNVGEVMKLISENTNTKSYNYAVFDFDNTCIINDIGEATFNYLCENEMLKNNSLIEEPFTNTLDYHSKVFNYYYDLLGQDKIDEAYALAAKCFSGFMIDEINSIVQKVIEFEGETITTRSLFNRKVNRGLKIRSEIRELFIFANKNDIEIWIVSASSKYIVEPAFKIFFTNVKVNIIGIENYMESNSISKNLIFPLSTLEGKVENIKDRINENIQPLFGVGDSINDKYMLEYSQLAIIIDRENSLTEYANEKGWIILDDIV